MKHITASYKMGAMPPYGKNPSKIFFSGTKQPMTLSLGMKHQYTGPYQSCSNDDPRLTFDLVAERSNLLTNAFI